MRSRIVLADDESDLRLVYGSYLRAIGYEVFEAENGEDAVKLVLEAEPSLLLLDVWMPKLNGFEVLERLRHEPRAINVKVVMLSNIGDSDTRLEGFAVGVTDYWLKTASLKELQARLTALLGQDEAKVSPDTQ
ncbi:response regulator [Singulisphaera sp. PoT]|uniref:response regulator n=1 Tax=Singulisphaera sp. PoT TaxID=3411797 RepID=UPI003BF4DBBD